MYLCNSWDLDDKFSQTPQIHATSLKQGFSDAPLFGAPNALRIDGFEVDLKGLQCRVAHDNELMGYKCLALN